MDPLPPRQDPGHADKAGEDAQAPGLEPRAGPAPPQPLGPALTLSDRLWALARNLWWSWHPDVIGTFRELDPVRWRQLGHNPVALLAEFSPERLERRADEWSSAAR